jgi:hypothetical protein
MNLELSEHAARLVRGQLVRQIVELEDELARAHEKSLRQALSADLITLRDLYERLTSVLDTPSSSQRASYHAP